MDNKESINAYSKLCYALGDAFKLFYDSQKLIDAKNGTNKLYSIGEILEIYPKLSKHLITKAINDGLLPVTRIGNERHFYLKDIDVYLKNNTSQEEAGAWRNNG